MLIIDSEIKKKNKKNPIKTWANKIIFLKG